MSVPSRQLTGPCTVLLARRETAEHMATLEDSRALVLVDAL
jgi:AsnC-type helix-turn-helix domain